MTQYITFKDFFLPVRYDRLVTGLTVWASDKNKDVTFVEGTTKTVSLMKGKQTLNCEGTSLINSE